MSSVGILIVDPYPDERAMYAEFLRSQGFTAIECDTPDTALEVAREQRVGAIVTRILQSGVPDGIELTRRVKADTRTNQIAVVIISTLIQPHVRAAAEAAGCDGFFLLPCPLHELAAELRRLTEASR